MAFVSIDIDIDIDIRISILIINNDPEGCCVCLICLSFSTAHTVLRCRQTVDLKAHHTVCVVCCYSSMHAMTLGQIVCGKMQIVCGKMNINARSTNLASSRGNCDQKQARFRRVGKVNRGEIERVTPSLNQVYSTKKLEHFFFVYES